jgi:hypothetical protein
VYRSIFFLIAEPQKRWPIDPGTPRAEMEIRQPRYQALLAGTTRTSRRSVARSSTLLALPICASTSWLDFRLSLGLSDIGHL